MLYNGNVWGKRAWKLKAAPRMKRMNVWEIFEVNRNSFVLLIQWNKIFDIFDIFWLTLLATYWILCHS